MVDSIFNIFYSINGLEYFDMKSKHLQTQRQSQKFVDDERNSCLCNDCGTYEELNKSLKNLKTVVYKCKVATFLITCLK